MKHLAACALLISACQSAALETSAPPKTPVSAAPKTASYDAVPLIPREVLFGNPLRQNAQLSPDGKTLAYIAPNKGVQNLWVRTAGKNDDRVLTDDRHRGIHQYFWSPNGTSLFYVQDKDGDENWHIYSVPLAGGDVRDLTPIAGVQAQVVAVEPSQPDVILIGLNDRDPRYHDVYRLDIKTGERSLVAQNDIGAVGWIADHKLQVRAAQTLAPDGGATLLYRRSGKGSFRPLLRWSAEDMFTTSALGFAEDNRTLYLLSSVDSNTTELRALDTRTRRQKVLASDPTADVTGILSHPTRHDVLAVRFQRERTSWQVIDDDVQADFTALRAVDDGDLRLSAGSLKNDKWIASFVNDDGPVKYYVWDRNTGDATFLFSHRPELENVTLARMRPIQYQARDGLMIHGYLTLPKGVEAKGLPTVVFPHGGPWARDSWGFDATAQWLANRGYAVLQPNFRGSTGYGKNFLNAGDKEWGGKMQDDITDGTKWLIETGIADKKRVCIMGGSYGGYATLMGLVRQPSLYACGVDIVGVANLLTWMNTLPSYWKPFAHVIHQRVGDPSSEEEFLKSRSPVYQAGKIRAPLLIAQGKNDPRVPRDESIQIRDTLKKAGKPVTYMEFADEGHGFRRPENRLRFFAAVEDFLSQHIGGRKQ